MRSSRTVEGLAASFGLPLDTAGLAEIVGGLAFIRHSKHGTAFAAANGAAEHRAAEQVRAEEIDKVARRAEVEAQTAGIDLALLALLDASGERRAAVS